MHNPTDTLFSSLQPGERARVLGFGPMPDYYRNRLQSMGLTPGTEFVVARNAPLGDPVQITLRGFRLSLRRSEAAQLKVQRL
jgi:ferrous iron transport protein A